MNGDFALLVVNYLSGLLNMTNVDYDLNVEYYANGTKKYLTIKEESKNEGSEANHTLTGILNSNPWYLIGEAFVPHKDNDQKVQTLKYLQIQRKKWMTWQYLQFLQPKVS